MPTAPPLARTSAEAHLYMDLNPCECGGTALSGGTSIVELGDGLGSRYDGACEGCGTRREFLFRLPDDVVLPRAGTVVYGDGTRSELLDPGEWVWVADRYAGSVPAEVAGLDDDTRRQVRIRLAAAVAAMDEALAFVEGDAVPPEAFRTELGRLTYDEDPGRFDRDRLEIVRDTYRGFLD